MRAHEAFGVQLALVMLGAALFVLPYALGPLPTSPDSIEHLAIANAWIHGQGFVDPIQYYFYLPTSPPSPAFAVRAPMLPLVLAAPLAAGLSPGAIYVLHGIWSSVVAGVAFWVCSRFMSRAAAAATVLLITSPLTWLLVSLRPLTEVTGLFWLLLLMAAAKGLLGSTRAALVCALLTLLAWLTRPNLGVMVVVLGVATVWQLGPRRALRHRPLYAYLLGFAFLYLLVRLWVGASTGFAPYAGYGIIAEHFSQPDFKRYAKVYVGGLAFAQAHGAEIFEVTITRVGQLAHALFVSPVHGFLGWLLPIGIVHTLACWRTLRFEQAIGFLAMLAFTAPVILNYAAFDAFRYPLFPLICGVIVAISALDALAPAAAARLGVSPQGRRAGLAVLVGLLFLFAGWRVSSPPLRDGRAGDIEAAAGRPSPALDALCPRLDPDARVAAPRPWKLHERCGNAVIVLPIDAGEPGVLARFLAEHQPAYVIGSKRLLEGSSELRQVAGAGALTLFERIGAGAESRPWKAPPALACAGDEAACELRDGRLRIREPRGALSRPSRGLSP